MTNSQDYNNIKTSEMLSMIYNIDSGEYLFTALNKSLIELVVGNLLETYIKTLFMHSDNWGQYGPATDDRPKLDSFINGYTLVS